MTVALHNITVGLQTSPPARGTLRPNPHNPRNMATQRSPTVMAPESQLPIWPNDLRGLPNAFARSALFNVANTRKGARQNLKRHPIAALAGITITYTGEELRQDDEDVFLQILHVARLHALGNRVCFTANSLIGELGWSRNTKSYTRLVDTLDRMKASAVAVTVQDTNGQKENYTGSLIRSFRWKENASGAAMREWEVLLEKEIVALFNPESYTRLDWKVRLKLPPLAKWLHSFYHSHQSAYPLKVETLRGLTGSEIKQLFAFRAKLKAALVLLVDQGFFVSAHIDERTDLVMVQRAQALHLA